MWTKTYCFVFQEDLRRQDEERSAKNRAKRQKRKKAEKKKTGTAVTDSASDVAPAVAAGEWVCVSQLTHAHTHYWKFR